MGKSFLDVGCSDRLLEQYERARDKKQWLVRNGCPPYMVGYDEPAPPDDPAPGPKPKPKKVDLR